MNSRFKPTAALALWCLVLYAAWLTGPWSGDEATTDMSSSSHDARFHMHQPLHNGGKVTMSGQFHLELISQPDGTHRLWLSDAVRQEMSPVGFVGELRVESLDGEVQETAFKQIGRSFELQAKTEPLKGQAWLTISGTMGEVTHFDHIKLFWDYDLVALGATPPLGLDPMLPRSAANPISPEKVALGRDLFFDARLSADGTVSCATCHQPQYAFAEPRPVASGIGGLEGKRNTPTILNAAYQKRFYWDGRSETLEEQAQLPILNQMEMGNKSEAELIARLKPIYERRIQEVCGQETSLRTVAQALACFERTLLSGDSDFDRYESGESNAISAAARRGRTLFFGKGGCGDCHVPPLFSDYNFHNLGVGWRESGDCDTGRFEKTGDPRDRGVFRTPSLRDVSRTAPYMHDGSLHTLHEVIEFYNDGGRNNPSLDPRIHPLGLTPAEIGDLIQFLLTLDGRFDYAEQEAPQPQPPATQNEPGEAATQGPGNT
jgi:cytochrome c peroxidase